MMYRNYRSWWGKVAKNGKRRSCARAGERVRGTKSQRRDKRDVETVASGFRGRRTERRGQAELRDAFAGSKGLDGVTNRR